MFDGRAPFFLVRAEVDKECFRCFPFVWMVHKPAGRTRSSLFGQVREMFVQCHVSRLDLSCQRKRIKKKRTQKRGLYTRARAHTPMSMMISIPYVDVVFYFLLAVDSTDD